MALPHGVITKTTGKIGSPPLPARTFGVFCLSLLPISLAPVLVTRLAKLSSCDLANVLIGMQVIVPDAEKHFVVGMLTLSQALLRDVRILCSNEDTAASQVFDDLVRTNLGDVTKLLLGDLGFARQVCESAYVVSQYEAMHPSDLLHRLCAAGFRVVHVHHPALRKPRSGRVLVKQASVTLNQ